MALAEILDARLAMRSTAEWVKACEEVGIPVGPVKTYDQVLTDEQVLARGMVQDVEHPTAGPMRTLGIPVKLSATPGTVRRPAPRLGEHTAEIIAEIETRGRSPGAAE